MIGPSRDRWRRGRTPRWRRGGTQGWPASWLGTCYVRGARCNRRSTVSVGRQVLRRPSRQAGAERGNVGNVGTWERLERKAERESRWPNPGVNFSCDVCLFPPPPPRRHAVASPVPVVRASASLPSALARPTHQHRYRSEGMCVAIWFLVLDEVQ